MKILILVLLLSSSAFAQSYGTNYIWSHNIAITTTAKDSLFSTIWEEVVIWSYDAVLMIRVAGAPLDTVSFNSRVWLTFAPLQTVRFGPETKLQRLQFKALSGTGTCSFIGLKKRRQY